jgi:hypothetical protein
MIMRNFIKAGFVLLVAGVVMTSACSSDKPSGTNVISGTGGATGAGGTDGGGADAPTGAGGSAGAAGSAGTGGAGGTSTNGHQNHLDIINSATLGGMTVNRPAPIPYDTCKI